MGKTSKTDARPNAGALMSEVYQFKVRIGVVLIKDGRILLVRQNNRPFWVFPGGTLEVTEGIEECAVREMKEEVNLDVEIVKTLYFADFMHLSKDNRTRHTVDIFLLAEYLGGTPMMEVTENINEMGFFTLEAFGAMAVEPAVAATRVMIDWPAQFLDANGLYIGKYGVIHA